MVVDSQDAPVHPWPVNDILMGHDQTHVRLHWCYSRASTFAIRLVDSSRLARLKFSFPISATVYRLSDGIPHGTGCRNPFLGLSVGLIGKKKALQKEHLTDYKFFTVTI